MEKRLKREDLQFHSHELERELTSVPVALGHR
jgi:hypothetical protein